MAYSPADMAGRVLVEQRLSGLGLDVRRDAAANVIGTLAGTRPSLRPIAIGSHTDTVPEGGPLDGALGVAAAIACARAIRSSGLEMRHSLEVIDFAAEEATMGGGVLGSRAMAGQLELSELEGPAWDGRPISQHLETAGVEPERFATAARPKDSLAAYLELHIEQGGVLEQEGAQIGVVEGIVGIRRYELTFLGQANHAGTTPMRGRRDALVMAAPFVSGVRELALAEGIVGTVGTLAVHPGASNVIPGRVELTCEIRSLDDGVLTRAEWRLVELASAQGGTMEPLSATAPVRSARRLVDALTSACGRLGLSYRVMPSGAGHDAMCMAAITDMVMLFVPSRGGVSHSPDEYTSREDIGRGARVLLETLRDLDTRLT